MPAERPSPFIETITTINTVAGPILEGAIIHDPNLPPPVKILALLLNAGAWGASLLIKILSNRGGEGGTGPDNSPTDLPEPDPSGGLPRFLTADRFTDEDQAALQKFLQEQDQAERELVNV